MSLHLMAQFECQIIPSNSKSSQNFNSIAYIPNNNTTVKIIRVNIHYMLRATGTPLNFTETDDGNGNSNYTGYNFAEDLVNLANTRLNSNHQLNIPPTNTIAILPRKYQYILNGVYFHRNDSYYIYPSYPNDIYGQNKGEAINVYLELMNNSTAGGHGNMDGIRYVELKGSWEAYVANPYDFPTVLWIKAEQLNHEIGHNLSLLHSLRYDDGPCNPNQEDYCSDTPTGISIINAYGFDPCCGWNQQGTLYNGMLLCSNNLMDYTGDDAISPEQLGRIHWTLENELKNYQTCHFSLSSLDVCGNFGYPQKVYIASNINAPGSSCSPQQAILQNNKKAIFIGNNTVILNPGFEVQLGSEFEIQMNNICP